MVDKKSDDKFTDDKLEDTPTKAERAEKAEAAKAKAKLAPASTATDEGVKNLAAERAVHLANGSTLRVEEIDRTLADLGYSAD